MSTRASIHFAYKQTHGWGDLDENGRHTKVELDEPVVRTEAIVYRHSDGYPEGLGQELVEFIAEVSHLKDTRLGDPSYLAGKWVVYDYFAGKAYEEQSNREQEAAGRKPYYADRGRLEFTGLGIVNEDPGDIEYRYTIVCDGKVEDIICEHLGFGGPVESTTLISTTVTA